MNLTSNEQLDTIITFAARTHMEKLRTASAPTAADEAYIAMQHLWNAVTNAPGRINPGTAEELAELKMEADWLAVEQYR